LRPELRPVMPGLRALRDYVRQAAALDREEF
jgi:hypothetical protein